jgi:hypothetical protein
MVPVADVVREAGVSREDVRTVERKGWIEPAGRKGQGGAHLLTHDDAMFLLGAAIIAVAAGLAVVTMVRVLRETGAMPGPAGMVIPFPSGLGAAAQVA